MEIAEPSSSEKKRGKSSGSGRALKVAVGVWGAVCTVALIYYMGRDNSYSVETSLIYISGQQMAKNVLDGSLSHEVQVLNNPKVRSLLAGEVFGAEPDVATGREQGTPAQAVAPGSSPVTIPSGYTRFGNADQFRTWLSEELSSQAEVSPGIVKATLRLRGDNPDFLSSVLTSYVSQYLDYRRSMEPVKKDTERPAEPVAHAPRQESLADDPIPRELERLQRDQQIAESALTLIDSGQGVFSGFIPEGNLFGTPVPAQLQNRIVRLEMDKKALLVKYTPESREVRGIDQEIQGLRSDLRAFIVELLRLSEARRTTLLARKAASPDVRTEIPTETHTSSKAVACPQLDIGALFVSSDGTCIFWQRPSVAKKPLLVRTREYVRRLAADL
jgi:hypothetical protein